MLRFQTGEEEAFRLLFLQFKTPVFQLIFRYFNDADLAEELTQETFLRVYKARNSYKPMARFSTWIFRIAGYLCLNTLRNRKKERPLDETTAEPVDEGLELGQEQSERHDAILQALQKLPDTQRLLMVLVYVEEMSVIDAAHVVGVTPLGARLRLFRAREKIKAQLGKSAAR